MFKSRSKKAEEEAKQEENYIPTKDLEAEEEKVEYNFPWKALIIGGSLLAVIIILVVIIFVLGGPINK